MKSVLLWATALTLAILIIGCGGGGGGTGQTGGSNGGSGGDLTNNGRLGLCPVSAANGVLSYTTRWGTAPSDASQIIQVIDSDGNTVRSDSMSRLGQGSSTISMAGLPASVAEVRATLYSGPGATGSVLGVARTILDLCGRAPLGTTLSVRTTVGETPVSLQTTPTRVTLQTQQPTRYITTVRTADGSALFVAPSAITWTAGALGTFSSDGTLSPTNAGTGLVTASLPSAGLTTTSELTVTETPIRQGKWTILVFLNAANDLYQASDLNMDQMERVAGNPDVRFVVQWKQSRTAFPGSSFDGVRRYLVQPDQTNGVVISQPLQVNLRGNNGQPLDMGDPQVLNDFITWGKANYPADRYVLVIWNHGAGWRRSATGNMPTRGFSYDDESGNAIQTWETDQALAGHSFDILAWDASLMQMIEVAYEARSYANYIVGSEESPPADGYPYDAVFGAFRDVPNRSTRDLSKRFVDAMVNHPPYEFRKITQSVLESSKLGAVAVAVDELAKALIAAGSSNSAAVIAARNNSQSYSPTSVRFYRDLVHLCQLLEADPSSPAAVRAAAVNVRAAVANAVVWEGHNSQSPNSNGVSIDFSPSSAFLPSQSDYLRLKFAKDTLWGAWLGQAP
ncbi:MAG: clostripain-related cysteine peptidase [Fimbriimonadaceae bacterium]|nr:clostripain-related cysteine peptidase [Fimbriimonadaceae bacterium]